MQKTIFRLGVDLQRSSSDDGAEMLGQRMAVVVASDEWCLGRRLESNQGRQGHSYRLLAVVSKTAWACGYCWTIVNMVTHSSVPAQQQFLIQRDTSRYRQQNRAGAAIATEAGPSPSEPWHDGNGMNVINPGSLISKPATL